MYGTRADSDISFILLRPTAHRYPVRTTDSYTRTKDYRAPSTTNESEELIGAEQVPADDSKDAAEYVTNKRPSDSDGRTDVDADYSGHGRLIGAQPTGGDYNDDSSADDRVDDSDIRSIILANNRLVAQLHRSIALANDNKLPELPNHSNYRHEQRINSKAAQLATRGTGAANTKDTPTPGSGIGGSGNRANYHPDSLDALVRKTIDFDIDKTLDYGHHRLPYPYLSDSNGRLSDDRPADTPIRYGSELDSDSDSDPDSNSDPDPDLDSDSNLSNSSSRLDRHLLSAADD